MRNERVNRRTFAVSTIAAIMLIATMTSMSTTGNVFASDRNQVTSQVNDCANDKMPTNVGCQTIDSQIQGDRNSVDLTAQQKFPRVTSEPPVDQGFTIEGSGTTTGASFECTPPIPSNLAISIVFSAQSDGDVTGTYELRGGGSIFTGELTDGTTDGNTFTLSGVGEISICTPQVVDTEVTISGDCGNGVPFTYRDESAEGTFTGDVECTLT